MVFVLAGIRRYLEASCRVVGVAVFRNRVIDAPPSEVGVLLAPDEAYRHASTDSLPPVWRVRVGSAGVLTVAAEELVVETRRVERGDVVCVLSGNRLAWRRALEVRGERVLVRADVAPFADGWCDGIVGCVRPRALDHLARLDPERFTRANWTAAMALARWKAAYRRLQRARNAPRAEATSPGMPLRACLLSPEDWPKVLAFWLRASGRTLPMRAPPGGYVVGLLTPLAELVGVNVQLVTGSESYSAYTMIERGYRGVGGSRLLLQESLRVAEELGVKRIYVHIHARNVPSLAAYEGAGFRFSHWWRDDADPMLAAERQWRVFERQL